MIIHCTCMYCTPYSAADGLVDGLFTWTLYHFDVACPWAISPLKPQLGNKNLIIRWMRTGSELGRSNLC